MNSLDNNERTYHSSSSSQPLSAFPTFSSVPNFPTFSTPLYPPSTHFPAHSSSSRPIHNLDDEEVTRGVAHAHYVEARIPDAHDADFWLGHAQHNQAAKKNELHVSATYNPPTQHIQLPTPPSHVERYTSFYSSSKPIELMNQLEAALKNIQGSTVEVIAEKERGKFKAVCYSPSHESIHFVARLYFAPNALILVEFQRRYGCCVSFQRFYRGVLSAMEPSIHSHYDSAPSPQPPVHQTQTLTYDAFTMSNLCGMVCGSRDVASTRDATLLLVKLSESPASMNGDGFHCKLTTALHHLFTSCSDIESQRMGSLVLLNLSQGESVKLLMELLYGFDQSHSQFDLLSHLFHYLNTNVPSSLSQFDMAQYNTTVVQLITMLTRLDRAANPRVVEFIKDYALECKNAQALQIIQAAM